MGRPGRRFNSCRPERIHGKAVGHVPESPVTAQGYVCSRIAQALEAGVPDPVGYETLARLKLPGPDYLEVLKVFHQIIKPRLYVEIGVRDGDSLRMVQPETRIIGVDPEPRQGAMDWVAGHAGGGMVAVSTSDSFFSQESMRGKANGFGMAFIDGDHTFFQAAKDFENLERLAYEGSVVLLHDVIPMDFKTSTPDCNTGFWTGDVWRLMAAIIDGRPDLAAFTIACPPTGLGVVCKFGGEMRGVPPSFISKWAAAEQYMIWEVLEKRLNIVENDAPAILKAFNKQVAA